MKPFLSTLTCRGIFADWNCSFLFFGAHSFFSVVSDRVRRAACRGGVTLSARDGLPLDQSETERLGFLQQLGTDEQLVTGNVQGECAGISRRIPPKYPVSEARPH